MLHKNIKILTWFNFFTDFNLYAPIAIIYFARVTGSYALGMSIFSITMITSALCEVPTGIFSDYVGRRKTVMFGAFSAILYAICYAIGQSFWILAIGAIFEGLSRSFYSGNNDALLHASLSETNNEHQYEEYLGRVSSMFQISAAIAAIAGSILANWSFSLIMWLSVIPQLICFILSFKIIEPKGQTRESGNVYEHLQEAFKQFLGNKKLRLISISSILSYGIGESTYQFRAAFFNAIWPLWAIGIARALSSIGAFFSFHYSGRIINKFGHLRTLITGSILNRFINIFALSFITILSPIFMAGTSIFYGVMTVCENSLMQKEFTDKQRATMGSLNSFAGSIVFAIIAVLLGFIGDTISPGKALLYSQIFLLPILFIYWLLFKHQQIKS